MDVWAGMFHGCGWYSLLCIVVQHPNMPLLVHCTGYPQYHCNTYPKYWQHNNPQRHKHIIVCYFLSNQLSYCTSLWTQQDILHGHKPCLSRVHHNTYNKRWHIQMRLLFMTQTYHFIYLLHHNQCCTLTLVLSWLLQIHMSDLTNHLC